MWTGQRVRKEEIERQRDTKRERVNLKEAPCSAQSPLEAGPDAMTKDHNPEPPKSRVNHATDWATQASPSKLVF